MFKLQAIEVYVKLSEIEEDSSVTKIELSNFISFVSFNAKINNNLYINFFFCILTLSFDFWKFLN